MSVRPAVRTANGTLQYVAGNVPELNINLSLGVTLTDQAAALGYLNQDNGNIILVDLSAMAQVRLTARVKTASVSAGAPKIRVGYNTTLQTVAASVIQLGRTAQVEASIFTGVTMADSGWLDLAAGAQIDNCFVSALMIGGDAAADPVLGIVTVSFR